MQNGLEQQEDIQASVVGIVMQGPEPKPIIDIEEDNGKSKFDVNKTPHERIPKKTSISKRKKPKFSV